MAFDLLVKLVSKILSINPLATVTEIETVTGADYEDVLWAMKRASSDKS